MISIIIPSMGREERLDAVLHQFEREIPRDAEIIAVVDTGNKLTQKMVNAHRKTRFIVSSIQGCWRCTSIGLDIAKHELVMWTADDIKPRRRWYQIAIERFHSLYKDGLGLLILNDLHVMNQTAGHAITTKKFLTVLFGEPRFPPGFVHFFCDTLVADWAKMINRCHFCTTSILEHLHWTLGKSARDRTNEAVASFKPLDKAYKDGLDFVWYNGGGKERALERLKEYDSH